MGRAPDSPSMYECRLLLEGLEAERRQAGGGGDAELYEDEHGHKLDKDQVPEWIHDLPAN